MIRTFPICRTFVFVVLFLFGSTGSKSIGISCPEFCECDVFENLRRAACQNKKLVSIELNIPSEADILDVNYNQISELDDSIFVKLGLTDLKLLNLSHNKVRQIHFNGFKGLKSVKTLDLSFNALEYFTASWFESLSSLQELYLRGNKLKDINRQPLMDVKTLKVLDLSKCGINSLQPGVFQKLPNLERLDISENYISVLTESMFKPLTKLQQLNVLQNNFNCNDRRLIIFKNYIINRKIVYKDPCIIGGLTFNINNKVEKFQKMIMQDDDVETTKSVLPKNSWIINDDNNYTKIIEVCSNATNDTLIRKDLLMEIIDLSPWLAISVTFFYGVLFGMVLTCAINLCVAKKHQPNTEATNETSPKVGLLKKFYNMLSERKKTERRKARRNSVLYSSLQRIRRHLSRENLRPNDAYYELVMNELGNVESTPMQSRRIYL